MNEELQNAIIGLINKAVEGAEKGAAFLEGQIPDYIMQLLMWHGWYNFLLFIVSAIIFVSIVVGWLLLARKGIQLGEDANKWINDGGFIFIVIGGVYTIFGGIAAAVAINLIWLKIWLAPKVWLVEYATNLVK